MSTQVALSVNATAALPLTPPRHRVSTRNLDLLDSVIKTGSLYYAYQSNSSAALLGASVGAGVRISAGLQSQESERSRRITLIRSTCLTVAMAAYATCSTGPHTVAPFLLGLLGMANGVLPLLHDVID